jgi:hypothetical protein
MQGAVVRKKYIFEKWRRTTCIMWRESGGVVGVECGHQDQPGFRRSGDAFDGIEYFDCAYVIDVFCSLVRGVFAGAGGKVDDVRSVKS